MKRMCQFDVDTGVGVPVVCTHSTTDQTADRLTQQEAGSSGNLWSLLEISGIPWKNGSCVCDGGYVLTLVCSLFGLSGDGTVSYQRFVLCCVVLLYV